VGLFPRTHPGSSRSTAPAGSGSLQSARTVDHDTQAVRLYVNYRRAYEKSDVPTKKELEGRGAEMEMIQCCVFCADGPIPHAFDENMQPPKDSEGNVKCPSVIVGYVGKYLKLLRSIYPDHPDWSHIPASSNEGPSWWKPLKDQLSKRCTNNELTYQGDFVWGDMENRALYPDLEDEGEFGDHPLRIVETANLSNQNIQLAAMLTMSYDAIARDGEIRFQNFTKWRFDYFLKVLDTRWSTFTWVHMPCAMTVCSATKGRYGLV